jgi:hypothetical protein
MVTTTVRVPPNFQGEHDSKKLERLWFEIEVKLPVMKHVAENESDASAPRPSITGDFLNFFLFIYFPQQAIRTNIDNNFYNLAVARRQRKV